MTVDDEARVFAGAANQQVFPPRGEFSMTNIHPTIVEQTILTTEIGVTIDDWTLKTAFGTNNALAGFKTTLSAALTQYEIGLDIQFRGERQAQIFYGVSSGVIEPDVIGAQVFKFVFNSNTNKLEIYRNDVLKAEQVILGFDITCVDFAFFASTITNNGYQNNEPMTIVDYVSHTWSD